MAKFVHDNALDALLDYIALGNILTVCETQPSSRAEAVTDKGSGGKKLADVALTPGDGNGDFTIADGDASGRKVTVTQQADVAVDVTGDADHIAICDDTNLLLVTTCTQQTLTAGNTVTVPSFDDEVADPS